MKNNHSYRLAALLLAVVMMIGILPVAAVADVSNLFSLSGPYSYDATEAATISYASDGNAVNNVSDLNPNKVSTMIVSVPDSDALPRNKSGEIVVKIPENVIVTSEQAKACEGEGITCSYRSSRNQLVFKWSDEKKDGFTAVIPISPNMPATRRDVSGSWVLVVKNPKGQLIVTKPEMKVIDNAKRLTAVEGTIIFDSIYRAGTDLPEWKLTRYTGDWYSISYNGQYINYGKDGNNIILSNTPEYYLYTSVAAGNQFVGFDNNGTRYYLNNKSENVDKGIQASTYDNQSVLLYKELKATADNPLVTFNVNGGTADKNLTPISVKKGESIILPEYKGTKNNSNFMGWATRGNIKVNTYTEIYQPGDSYTVEEEVAFYAAWTSKNPEKSQFGIRMSGDIPDEPAQYDVGAYSKEHVFIDGTVINGKWVVDTDATGQAISGNHVVNSVTANLKNLPSDEDIKKMYPNYDPETMYVHWYVLKYAGMWKVDGVIVNRTQQADIRYDANVAMELRGKVKNIPAAYKVTEGTTIKVGTGVEGKTIKDPVYEDNIFAGWNTKADGSGEAYEPGADYEASESVTFYAQWTKIPTFEVAYEFGEEDTKEYHAGDTVKVPVAEDKMHYIFSGWLMNGEPIEGTEFIMPDADVVITARYYGPIDVEIVSDWEDGKIGYYGAKIKLTAVVKEAEDLNLDYSYQWQYVDGNGQWVNLEGATEVTTTYVLNEETSARVWRVIVTDARPHQD